MLEQLPTKRVEAWRWSDVRAAVKHPPVAAARWQGDIPAASLQVETALDFVFANGILRQQPLHLPAGMRVAYEVMPSVGDTTGVMEKIAAQHAAKMVVIEITQPITDPICIRYLSQGAGHNACVLKLVLADGATCHLIEEYTALGSAFGQTMTHIFVGRGARVTRLVVQPEAPEAVLVNTAAIRLAEKAHLTQTSVGRGAKLARFETQLRHEGPYASAVMNGAYSLNGRAHFDLTSHVDHQVGRCQTYQLCKGMAQGNGKGVFQGKFHVARNAQETDAQMAHHALLLSNTADIFAKPELEIYADDVQCTHGNTVGALDEAALFYMCQRGLNTEQSRAILVAAFLAEALAAVDDESLKVQLAGLINIGEH